MALALMVALMGAVLPAVFAVPASAAPGRCAAGLVALTFDDGPSPAQTPRLVRILTNKHVPATFFMVGSRVRSSPETARLVQRSGFQIGNHTWSHSLLTELSDLAVQKELVATSREMHRHGIHPGPWMRPPYGGINPRVRRDIVRLGGVPVLWSVDSRDWAGGNPRQIADRILAQLRPHRPNVVLQHDGVNNSPASIAAVPLVVDEARRRGYCFTDLNRLGRPQVPVPQVRAVIGDGSEQPGHAVRVYLSLDRPTTRAVSFRLRTIELGAESGLDFVPVAVRVTFPPGNLRQGVRIRVLNDAEPEHTESLRIGLDAASGLTIPRSRYLALIQDNDSAGPTERPTATPVPRPAPMTDVELGPLLIGALDLWRQLR